MATTTTTTVVAEDPASSYFRSEEMSLVQLYIPSEAGHASVSELGRLGVVQFRDLNPQVNQFQRAYTSFIKRLDEMEHKVQFLITEATGQDMSLSEPSMIILDAPRSATEIDELESKLAEFEARLLQMNTNAENLLKKQVELIEMKHVLIEMSSSFMVSDLGDSFSMPHFQASADASAISHVIGGLAKDSHPAFVEEDLEAPESRLMSDPGSGTKDSLATMSGGGGGASSASLGFIAGVIARTKSLTLESILWRALRGNLYMSVSEIEAPIVDPNTNEPIAKNVFIISVHGKETIAKIRKIALALGATIYPVEGRGRSRDEALELAARIEEVSSVLYSTKQAKRAELVKCSDHLQSWLLLIRREKAVYCTLNLCNYDANKKCLIAEVWTPKSAVYLVSAALSSGSQLKGGSNVSAVVNEIPTRLTPPTYHRTNKFTSAFQEIVDAYGVANYREVNPSLFTIITFPFLFAIMFGDFGHGLLITLFAMWLVLCEKRLEARKGGEIWGMIFGGRYIILLLGLFSMYSGLIYNDVFSRAFHIFPSAFDIDPVSGNSTLRSTTYAFPIGVDWAWIGATNALTFLNSYKMKQAIVIGVLQMGFGVVLSAYNMVYFGDWMGIVGIFLPQILFMASIFGYLALMIVVKWIIQDPSSPSLLTMLIDMVLKPGTINSRFYSWQGPVQVCLLILAFICVPWMLLAKPLMLRRQHKQRNGMNLHRSPQITNMEPHADEGKAVDLSPTKEPSIASSLTKKHPSMTGLVEAANEPGSGHDAHGEGFNFSETMVHQAIHTIEFTLGSVSNTASYLRLWALSLAHAQLSEVLWHMVAERAATNAIMAIVAYAGWFILTVAILIIMEGLSAFLHALRLHWVEFNNKFYQGSGVKFEPFSYRNIALGASSDAD